MSLEDGDEVVGMITIDQAETATRQVLVVSETGYGKRSPVDDYRITNRGGKGVKTLQVTDKTGKVIAIKDVTDEDQLMIINRSGITIRTRVSELRVLGRATQGVRLIELREKDRIAAVAKVDSELSEDEEQPEAGEEGTGDGASPSENGTEVDNGTPEA
jgi:DNA gyrase subunit A